MEAQLLRARGNTGRVSCQAYVGDQLAASAEIMFVLVVAR
jgi:3-hydroxymyristoyl/3-hydroxydecanoyl-(acyl carrier protein) dehydratase